MITATGWPFQKISPLCITGKLLQPHLRAARVERASWAHFRGLLSPAHLVRSQLRSDQYWLSSPWQCCYRQVRHTPHARAETPPKMWLYRSLSVVHQRGESASRRDWTCALMDRRERLALP